MSPEFELKFDSESVVYYTTDGSDPRLVGGEVNPDAVMVSGGRTILSLIDTGAPLRVKVPGTALTVKIGSYLTMMIRDGSREIQGSDMTGEAGTGILFLWTYMMRCAALIHLPISGSLSRSLNLRIL